MKNTVNKSHMETEKATIVFGDCTLGAKSGNTHYTSSYIRGGPGSLNKNGKEWLYRETLPVFWRATTDNDRGSGSGFKSGTWSGVGLYPKVKEIEVLVDNRKIGLLIAPVNNQYLSNGYAGIVEIISTLETNIVSKTQVIIPYQAAGEGKTFVKMHYVGQRGLPGLPVSGIRFIMPTKAKFFEHEGLLGETYPDQLAGGIEGAYKVEGLPIPPYLVP